MVLGADLTSSPYVSDSETERENARQRALTRPAIPRAKISPSRLHSPPKELQTHTNSKSREPTSPLKAAPGSNKVFDLLDEPEGENAFDFPSPVNSRRDSSRSLSPEPAAPPPGQQRYQQPRLAIQELSEDEPDSDHEEASPRSLFAQHLNANFAYQPAASTSKSSIQSATNYFKSKPSSGSKAPSSSGDSKKSKAPSAPKASSSKASTRIKAADFDASITSVLPLSAVGLLTQCPVCQAVWTTKKSSAVKLGHTLDCAKKRDYELETVRVLVEKRLREMQQAEELEESKDKEKTLFDSVIGGAGHGVMRGGKKAAVRLVGTDDGAMASTQGGTLHQDASSTQVSKEIDRTKKKPRANATSKVGKAVKLLDANPVATQPSAATLSATRHTGRLQSYTHTKDRLAQKAQFMLNQTSSASDLGVGTSTRPPGVSVTDVIAKDLGHKSTAPASGQFSLHNFTSAAPRPLPASSTRQVIDLDSDSEPEAPISVQRLLDEAPPLTQPLPPSRIAQKHSHNIVSSAPASSSSKHFSFWSLAGSGYNQIDMQTTLDPVIPSDSPLPSSPGSLPTTPRSVAKTPPLTSSPSVLTHQKGPSPVLEGAMVGSRLFSTSMTSQTDSSTEHAPVAETMPDYTTWSLSDLQAEASKFGYKPPGTKIASVNLVTKIWEVLHARQQKQMTTSSSETRKAKSKTPKATASTSRSKKSSSTASSEDLSKAEETPAKKGSKPSVSKSRKPRISAASMADAGEDLGDEEVVEGLEDLDVGFKETMKRLIVRDKEIYLKMLRYHPISFETFDRLANDNNLKHTAIGLRRFLDQQGITFYMEGPHKDRTRGSNKSKKAPKAPAAAKKTAAAGKGKSKS